MIVKVTGETINISCKDCNRSFEFTAGDQEFYAAHGFHMPVRCHSCRQNKRDKDSGRKMVYGICSNCRNRVVLDDTTGLCEGCAVY